MLVDTRFQVLFHSPLGVLFTFPSRYLFTIGRWVVFRLGGWSHQIPAGLHVSCGTQVLTTPSQPTTTGLSPSMARRSKRFVSIMKYDIASPTTPLISLSTVWPLPPSLAATRGITVLFSFPTGTEMFHFPVFAPHCLCIQQRVLDRKVERVAPFGNPRIKACERLPEAYRSCPRPSSPPIAKASTVRP